ncbi:MAG: hypothetical protein AAGC81_01880 [Pseudomonadota bacterium]
MIISLHEGARALGMDPTAKGLAGAIHQASVTAEIYAGRAFGKTLMTEDHMGGGCTLQLKRAPVERVDAILDRIDGSQVDFETYRLASHEGLITRLPEGKTWLPIKPIPVSFEGNEMAGVNVARWRVVYIGGPQSAPGEVRSACIDILRSLHRGEDEIPMQAREKLNRFRPDLN